MFQDLIEILLKKKADLREEIEKEFAERSAKIDHMLDECGYVEPAEEVVEASGESVEAENGEANY